MENENGLPVHTAMIVACNLADALHYLQFSHLGNSLMKKLVKWMTMP